MDDPPQDHLERLLELARRLPADLKDGYRWGGSAAVDGPRVRRSAVVVGLGGSAIAGDLLPAFLGRGPVPTVRTVRGRSLPGGDAPEVAFLSSYSGDTRETIEAYAAARRRHWPCVVLSSGGRLGARAERDGVPWVRLPPGRPPRSALGWLLGALAGYVGIDCGAGAPASWEARCDRLGRREPELSRSLGGPARLARRVGDRQVVVVVPEELQALGARWASQIEENAKRLARVEVLPEAMHNALVAWDAMPRSDAARRAALFLLPTGRVGSTVHGAEEHLATVLRRRGVVVSRVALDGSDRADTVLAGLAFGDQFSLRLAERARVDPLEVRAIDRWKRRLARAR